MKNKFVLGYKNKLDALFAKTSIFLNDPEAQSEWAKYLCILTSGYIEKSIKEIYTKYAIDKSEPKVANYIKSSLMGFQNPNVEKIGQLANKFCPEWGKFIREEIESELIDAINSVVANRHNIAHGRNVDLTFAMMKTYYKNVQIFLDQIERRIND